MILLRLGRSRGADGAAFVAHATWGMPPSATDGDIPFLNRAIYVLVQFASYHCSEKAACSRSSSKCHCTLTARQIILQHIRLPLFRDTMLLMETSPIRIDHDNVFALCCHLWTSQRGMPLAQYFSTLPHRLLHSFFRDAVHFAHESAFARRFLHKACRTWHVRGVVACLTADPLISSLPWLSQQLKLLDQPAQLESLGAVGCLICIATCSCTTTTNATLISTVYDQLMYHITTTLNTLCLGLESTPVKIQLRAARALSMLCSISCPSKAEPLRSSVRGHATLLQTLVRIYANTSHTLAFTTCAACSMQSTVVPCFRYEAHLPYGLKSLVFNIANTLGFVLWPSGDSASLDLLHPTMRYIHLLLEVPALDTSLQETMTSLCKLWRTMVACIDHNEMAYALLQSLEIAHRQEHSFGMRSLLPLVTALPLLTSSQQNTLTNNLRLTLVELIMAIMAVPCWNTQHLCANALVHLSQCECCVRALSCDQHTMQISHLLVRGVGLHSLLTVSAALCRSKSTRHRLLSYPHYTDVLISFLPRLQRHASLVNAGYILWKLWKAIPPELTSQSSFKPVAPLFFNLLDETVAWVETEDDSRARVTCGAGVLAQVLAASMTCRCIESTWLHHIVRLCWSHLSRMHREPKQLVQLLRCMNLIFQQGSNEYVCGVPVTSEQIAGLIEIASSYEDLGSSKLHAEVATFATIVLQHHGNRHVLRTVVGGSKVWATFLPAMFGQPRHNQYLAGRLAFELCRGHLENSVAFVQNGLLVAADNVLSDLTSLDGQSSIRIADCLACVIGRVVLFAESRQHKKTVVQTCGFRHLIDMLIQNQQVETSSIHHHRTPPWVHLVCSAFRAMNRLVRVFPQTRFDFYPAILCDRLVPWLVPHRQAFAAYCTALRLTFSSTLEPKAADACHKMVLHQLMQALATETMSEASRKVAWRLLSALASRVFVEIDSHVMIEIIDHEVHMTPLGIVQALGQCRLSAPLVLLGYVSIELHTNMTFQRLHRWIAIAAFASQHVTSTSWQLDLFINNICDTVAALLDSSSIADQSSAAYIVMTLCSHASSAATAFASTIPDVLERLTQGIIYQLKHGHSAVYASKAAASIMAVRETSDSNDEIDLEARLTLLFPLLSEALYTALSKNRLPLALTYLDVTFEILHIVTAHNLSSTSVYSSIFNQHLVASLSIAILKQTPLPIPLKSLMCSSSLTTLYPDIPPFSDLSQSKLLQLATSLLRLLNVYALSCDIFGPQPIDHSTTTVITTDQYWNFLHCLATLLHPRYASTLLCASFVQVKIHHHLVGLLQLLQSWPQLLSQLLLILTNLFACYPPCRVVPLDCVRDIMQNSSQTDDSVVAGHALNVLWHLSRYEPNRETLFNDNDVLASIQRHLDRNSCSVGVEGCFGLLAVMATTSSRFEAYVLTPGNDTQWTNRFLNTVVGSGGATIVSSQFCKFMRNLAYNVSYVHVVRDSSLLSTTLVACLEFPCSKTALYASECLTKMNLPLPLNTELFKSLNVHLRYGLRPPSGQHAKDTIHTTQGALARRCVREMLSLTANTLQPRSILTNYYRPKQLTHSKDTFSLLLRVALHGPQEDQVLALKVARLYFDSVRCEVEFFTGTHFVLEMAVACLAFQRQESLDQVLGLFESITRSRGIQYVVLDNDVALCSIVELLRHTNADRVWRIVYNLSCAQKNQGRMLTALTEFILATTCPCTPDELVVARLMCSTLTQLVTTIECLPWLRSSLHEWLQAMALSRDSEILRHLCQVQRNLIGIGAGSHDVLAFEHILDDLLPIYSTCPISESPLLTSQLGCTLNELCALLLSFYKAETNNKFAGFQLQATESVHTHRQLRGIKKNVRLWQHKWVYCRGEPTESPHVFIKVLQLWTAACAHAYATVAQECLHAIFTFFAMVTTDSLSGCFLITDPLSIAFILRQLARCTTSDIELAMTTLKTCASVRMIATKFATPSCATSSQTAAGSDSMLELLCGVAGHVVRLEMAAGGPCAAHNPAFSTFLTCLSMLSENCMFLRADFLTTRRDTFGLVKLLVYLLHRGRQSASTLSHIAAKIWMRLAAVANFRQFQKLLQQTACDLCLTDEDVAHALILALYSTLFEFDMQINVLVRVMHSVLVRMVTHGRIDKGTPTFLRDNGLENIAVALREFQTAYDALPSQDSTTSHQDFGDIAVVVHWMKTLSLELSKYCVEGYDSLYEAFERSNHNSQLTQGIDATKHAVMCFQTSHYVVHLLLEAVLHAVADTSKHADVTLFFRRVEKIAGWIVLSLQNPEMDIGYFTHHIEALCSAVQQLLHIHAASTEGPAADNNNNNMGAPLTLVIETLHLHSWMWAFGGFRPYIKVSLGPKRAAYTGFHKDLSSTAKCRYPQLKTQCGNYIATNPANRAFSVMPDEMTESVDVQVWMYIPFSPVDMCIGQTSLTNLAAGDHSVEFYPVQRDKMRFDQLDPYGQVSFRVCVQSPSAVSHEQRHISPTFPFSTCGSSQLRYMCFVVWTVTSLWTTVQFIFEKCTSKDKLIGSYDKQSAYVECNLMMAQLLASEGSGSFASMTPLVMAMLSDPGNRRLCDMTWRSILATVDLYMPRRLAYFKSHLHVHEPPAHASSSTSVKHKYRLKEVCNGIAGLDFFVQHTKTPHDSIFKHFRPTALVQPQPHRNDVAVIVDTWRRRRGLNWQQLVIPHMSIFSLPQPRLPECNTAPRRLSERLSSAITSVQHVLLTSSHRISSSSPTSAALVLELSSKSTHFLRKALTDRTNDAGRPSIQPLKHIERIRKCRLATYCDLDPFDARSKLKVFNARAMLIPPVLYTDGPIAEGLHALAWVLLAVTVWRLSLARDAVRDASQMYHGLIRQTHPPPLPSRRRSNTVEVASLLQPPVSVSATVLRTEKQLRYYLVITQLKGLGVDLLYIWYP
ncbi:hypothetical protein DYB25_000290 [Aphanomyces astaci]|uniref:Uncharacterized protein n=1 Tax=Aphanomyces astaci TaxID=112090 RepID=A0A397B908_APHAT|nr:hypothetical protein DYB25_000290 [Aphanomyces astaci]